MLVLILQWELPFFKGFYSNAITNACWSVSVLRCRTGEQCSTCSQWERQGFEKCGSLDNRIAKTKAVMQFKTRIILFTMCCSLFFWFSLSWFKSILVHFILFVLFCFIVFLRWLGSIAVECNVMCYTGLCTGWLWLTGRGWRQMQYSTITRLCCVVAWRSGNRWDNEFSTQPKTSSFELAWDLVHTLKMFRLLNSIYSYLLSTLIDFYLIFKVWLIKRMLLSDFEIVHSDQELGLLVYTHA